MMLKHKQYCEKLLTF